MSTHDAMVVAPQPEAVEVGIDILRAGGNAIDAAIGCAFTQGVVDPMMCGIAGFGSLGIYMSESARLEYLDFHAPAPATARPDMWENLVRGETRDGYGFLLDGRCNDIGYQSVCLPAALKAYHQAHEEHGVLPWSEIVAPAIEWARSGWQVRPHVHTFWSDDGKMGRAANHERLRFTEASRKLYCRDDGTPKVVGDRVVNGDLANTLEVIARDGADAFYTGPISEFIVADMRANGGLIDYDDLAAYTPTKTAPLWGGYRDYRIATNQPPGGGLMLLEMLNILENFDLQAMGHNSADYIRVVSEAMKYATIDKDAHVGDPAFLDIPVARLISKEYANDLAERIRSGARAEVPRFNPGMPSKDTTHVSVVDRQGNCVTMTHSLGMPSGVITEGLGFMYNGCMGVFDPRPGRANSIAPGKARFSSICPSIIFKQDRPYLVIGAPGATHIAMGVLQAVLNVLDFGQSMAEAVATPRFSATSSTIDVSNRIPRRVCRALESDGYEVVRSPLSFGFAWVHGIRIQDGRADGGADPGADGMSLAVR